MEKAASFLSLNLNLLFNHPFLLAMDKVYRKYKYLSMNFLGDFFYISSVRRKIIAVVLQNLFR